MRAVMNVVADKVISRNWTRPVQKFQFINHKQLEQIKLNAVLLTAIYMKFVISNYKKKFSIRN